MVEAIVYWRSMIIKTIGSFEQLDILAGNFGMIVLCIRQRFQGIL